MLKISFVERRHPRVLLLRRHARMCVRVVFIYILLSGCTGEREQSRQPNPSSSPGWSEETHLRYARGFDLAYFEGFKMLYLYQGSDTSLYYLLPEGKTRPEAYPEAKVIHIPLQSLVALSTTHVALADFAGVDSIIVGLDHAQYVYDPGVRSRIEAGEVTAVGISGNLNQEMVIALQPDLLMVSGMPGVDLQKYRTVIDSGIPVLINTEWMEETPLGKAEWVKLMAALTNQEKSVNQKFDSVAAAYQQIARLSKQVTQKPAVISGSPFQGSWYVPGAQSYRAKLFAEAGADWPWQNDSSAVSLAVAFEQMYAYGQEADVWVNPGTVRSLDELAARDSRFADFKAVQTGQVYNNNRRMSPNGEGNDYYESGVVNPHLILADLTHIFHPELLPDHQLHYYQKLK